MPNKKTNSAAQGVRYNCPVNPKTGSKEAIINQTVYKII
jgi:hypothetical protein